MDRRDRNHKWYTSFDRERMVIVLEGAGKNGEDVEIPAKFEVCGTCEGQGKHVNPSIDSHGLTAEDFDEDPDFRENYFSGMYDVPCNECKGERVVPTVADNATEEECKLAEKWMQDTWEMDAEYEAERRMGA